MLNLPMALAIIGGMPRRFAPFVHLPREAARHAGHDAQRLRVSINTHGYVAETRSGRPMSSFRATRHKMSHIGSERGWPPMTRAHFDAGYGLRRILPSASRSR
jgi:hypothetical protein